MKDILDFLINELFKYLPTYDVTRTKYKMSRYSFLDGKNICSSCHIDKSLPFYNVLDIEFCGECNSLVYFSLPYTKNKWNQIYKEYVEISNSISDDDKKFILFNLLRSLQNLFGKYKLYYNIVWLDGSHQDEVFFINSLKKLYLANNIDIPFGVFL